MKNFTVLVSLLGMIVLSSCSKPASLDRSVLDDPARSSEEKEQDAHRKAIDVYTFLGIEPGITVADLGPAEDTIHISFPDLWATTVRYIA